MHSVLQLHEDTITGGAPEISLPALARMIFVVHGSATIGDKTFADGEAYGGEAAVAVKAGKDGVTVWRFEVAAGGKELGAVSGEGVRSLAKLSAALETIPEGDLLLRGDSVGFPPGGCAFDQLRPGRGLVRERPGAGVRAGGGGPAEQVHPGDGAAARADRQKLDRAGQRGRQGQAKVAAVQGVRGPADRPAVVTTPELIRCA
jgi:hypothetical protein